MAFDSTATNLVLRDTNGIRDVFVHDRLTRTTEGITVGPAGIIQGNGASFAPSISADGRVVAFWSHATNLVPEDTNGNLRWTCRA